ncbi:LCP family protein [Streptomyces sp. NPDC056244]|uniref:LCP family protein n=1 Tax=unclassified Streptomyces TaxID=2593676 RepID=UPI0035E2CDD8
MTTPPRSPRRPPRPAVPAPVYRPVRNLPDAGGPRRERPRWGTRAATTLSVLVLAAGGIGHAVVTSLDTGIGRVDAFKDMKNRPAAGQGLNLLLVGTDGRDRITQDERRAYRLGGAPCHCTDTIMLVHLSENGERASVVSVPRDSYAQLPEHTDPATGKQHRSHAVKLNAAYAEGGPNLTVRTLEHMTGVKINHYLEVDFASFMKTVDALGGVEICTPKALKDSYTGLDLTPGTHKLNGGQALQYVRSRHVDGAADLGRMRRQQRFLAALISQATSSGVLLNPVKFRDVTTTMLSSVRADAGFGTEQMLALNEAMRGFSPSSSEFTSVPLAGKGSGVAVKGVGSTVKWDPVKSKALFRALREDRPLTSRKSRQEPVPVPSAAGGGQQGNGRQAVLVEVAPEQIRVQVYNATRKDGLGRRADEALRATGFATTGSPLNADERDLARTVVLYDPRWDRSAKSLAAALPGSELRPARQQGPTLKVMIGTDYKGVTPVTPVAPATPVRAGEPPKDGQDDQFGTVTGDEVVCP